MQSKVKSSLGSVPRTPVRVSANFQLPGASRNGLKPQLRPSKGLSSLGLPAPGLRLLTQGDTANRYGNGRKKSDHGHAVTSALAGYFMQAGRSRLDFSSTLLRYGQGGAHARHLAKGRKGELGAVQYLNRVWETVGEHLARRPSLDSPQSAYGHLHEIRERIRHTSWKGRRATALKVLLFHLQTALRIHNPRHCLSQRAAAVGAGVARATVVAAHKLLQAEGWLKSLGVLPSPDTRATGVVSLAETWVVLLPSQPQTTRRLLCLGGATEWTEVETDAAIDDRAFSVLMALDAFAHRGMGATGAKVLCALLYADGYEGPLTGLQLAERASVSKATVYRKLQALAEHGLVDADGQTYSASAKALELVAETRSPEPSTDSRATWTAIAQAEGTCGTGARRVKRFADQRRQWNDLQFDRALRRRMSRASELRPDAAAPGSPPRQPVIDARSEQVNGWSWVLDTEGNYLLVEDHPEPIEDLQRRYLAQQAA